MKRDLIFGLDAGTSVIKAVAFTFDGAQVAVADRRNTFRIGNDGAATQDMTRCWEDCAATLRDLVARLDPDRDRIAALGVTGHGDGTWLIDAKGAPLGEGLMWLDSRAAGWVSAYAGAEADQRRFEATGTGITACQQGAQLNWMRQAMPEALGQASTAFHCKDWLYLQLTGVRATDPSEASFTFGNFRTRTYDDAVLDALDLTDLRHLLPPIIDGVTTSFPLTAAAAAATGLPVGLPVALGYLDAICTALGSGVHEGGRGFGCTIVGSTGVHMKGMATQEVRLDGEMGGYVLVLPIPGRVARMQTNMSGTLNLDWILGLGRDLVMDCGHAPPDLLARLEDWLAEPCRQPPLFHPYVSPAGERGPFVDPDARAGFIGLDTGHRFADLVRAVVSGLAMAGRDCYDAMGGTPSEVRLTGGAARSGGLRRIMADVLGVPVRPVLRSETGAAGAAMIAAVATGVQSGMESCITRWVSAGLGPADPPDAERVRQNAPRYGAYRAARLLLPPVWAALVQPETAEGPVPDTCA